MSAASVQEALGESRNDADSRFEPNKTGRNEVGPPEPPPVESPLNGSMRESASP